MTDAFNTELILTEILAVLEKHAVPVSAMALNVSMAKQDFEVIFPQIKDYKASVFYRALTVHNIPVTLRVQRRIPFDQIVQWLKENVLPSMQNAATKIEKEFKDTVAKFHTYYTKDGVPTQFSFGMVIECRLRDVVKIEFNTVQLSVGVSQFDGASPPQIYAYVGWLIDEESGGDFGLDIVTDLFPQRQEVDSGIQVELQHGLPRLVRDLKREVERIDQYQVS